MKTACELVQKTGSLKLVDPSVLVRNYSGLIKLQCSIQGPPRLNLKIITIIGYTRLGKSWAVRDRYPEAYCPYYGNSGLWWDGYTDQKVIILDEFRGQIQLGKLLKILDPYPLQLEVKGGAVWARYSIVFIISNSAPDVWYQNDNGYRSSDIDALYARLQFPEGDKYISIPNSTNLSNDRNLLNNRLVLALEDASPKPEINGLKRLEQESLQRDLELSSMSNEGKESDGGDPVVILQDSQSQPDENLIALTGIDSDNEPFNPPLLKKIKNNKNSFFLKKIETSVSFLFL